MNLTKKQIEVIPDDKVDTKTRQLFFEFEEGCFDEDLSEDRENIYFSTPLAHIVLKKEQEIVSYLRIFKRIVNWGRRDILIGGIGSVSTRQDLRGQGLATVLLVEAMSILKSEKVDFVLLQTEVPIGGRLYSRVGFEPFDKNYSFFDSQGKLHRANASDVMVAPLMNRDLIAEIRDSDKILHIGYGDW